MTAKVVLVNRNDDFDENEVCVGCVLWYSNQDINNPEVHPHVVVAVHEGYVYTVCGTSQQDTVERIIKNRKVDYSLFPAVDPVPSNGLGKRTFFDCTNNYDIHKTVLQDKFQNGESVNISGHLSYGDYHQIRTAIKSSKTSDIKDLLIHPDDDE